MKKTMKLFWLIAATAIVFSCSKESQDVTPTPTKPVEEDNTTTVIPAVDGNVLTSFGVTFEGNPVDPESKVTVDLSTGVTDLEVDDEVLVFVDGDNKAIYKYNGEDFELKGGETGVELDSPASVFYPADRFEKATGKFVMPKGIEATGDGLGAINPMAGVITKVTGNYTVELCNIASVLRVQVSADVDINSVKLDYGSAIYYAAGSKFTVDASEKTMSYAYDASDYTYDTVELETHAHFADVLFIIPTVGLPSGLTVTANLDEPHNGGANTFTVANESTDARPRRTISKMSFKAKLFDRGSGTSEDPYQIQSAKDFKYIQKYTAEGYLPGGKDAAHFLNAYYQQTADIDFKNTSITPIGGSSSSSRFRGKYDGNNKSLQNIKIEVDGQFAAPFAYLDGDAEIKNLTVSGSITNNGTTNNSLAGSIAGILTNNAKVTGCTSSATISSTATYTGGIAGRLYNSTAGTGISGCVNNGEVSGSGNYVGGIVGNMTGTSRIDSCTNTAPIESSTSGTSSYVAGIVGYAQGTGSVISCVNEGDIKANKPFAGGIAGDMNGTIDMCVNKGNVESTSSNVGGIAGSLRASSIVKRSYSSNDKTISGTNRVGGIVGVVNGAGSWVVTCFSNSNVTGTDNVADYGVGGIVGILTNGTVANCSTGDVTVKCSATCTSKDAAKVYVGGIVGYQNSDGTIQNVYSPLFAKDIKIGSIHGRSGSGKIGQIVGYTAGTLVGYYFGGCAETTTGWQYWGTNGGATATGQWAFTSANNVSMDWTQPIAKNYSNYGTSYSSGEYYLHDVMNVAISQEPLASGYTPATGELLTWSAIDATNSDYHPIPDELLNLGEDYYKN